MLISPLVRIFAALSGLLVLLAACSGGDSGDGDAVSPTITPEGECSTRTPVLLVGDLDDAGAQQSIIDLPARSPFRVTGVRMDAESPDWVYRQAIYITESPERASESLRAVPQQSPVADAPAFGDESSVWATEGEGISVHSAWIRKGPAAIILTVEPTSPVSADAANDKLLTLAEVADSRIENCEQWSPPTTASPVPTHQAAISILALDNVLEPSEVTIATGAIVEFTFTNQGGAIHNMHLANPETGEFSEAICEGLVEPCLDPSPVEPGGTANLVWRAPEDAVELPFRCDFHPREMTGTLIFE